MDQYGNLNFLLNFFNKTTKFLTFGTLSAYYTKLSAKQNEKKIIGFYSYYTILLIALLLMIIIGIKQFGFKSIIWPDQQMKFVYAAALFSILSLISNITRQTSDALGLTVKNEFIFIIQSFLGVIIMLTLYYFKILDLESYFIYNYFLSIFVIFGGFIVINKKKVFQISTFIFPSKKIKIFLKEFYDYSHPIFFHGLIIFFITIIDRILLQKYYGSVAQGYYGFALKLSGVIFLLSSSFAPLLLREFSINYKNKNHEENERLFKRFLPLFLYISTFLSLIVYFNSKEICVIVGGNEYLGASKVVSIMALYPILQTYAQFNGSVFMGLERTSIIRNIGFFTSMIGLVLMLALVTPIIIEQVQIGAAGLALKMVIVALISINIQIVLISKILNIPLFKLIFQEISIILGLFIFGYIAKYSSMFFSDTQWLRLFIWSIVFIFLSVASILKFPQIFGIVKSDIKKVISF